MENLDWFLPTVKSIFAVAGGGFVAALTWIGATTAWEQFWRRYAAEAAPKYQITVLDPDGIPIRKENVSATSAARLIRDFEAGYYK